MGTTPAHKVFTTGGGHSTANKILLNSPSNMNNNYGTATTSDLANKTPERRGGSDSSFDIVYCGKPKSNPMKINLTNAPSITTDSSRGQGNLKPTQSDNRLSYFEEKKAIGVKRQLIPKDTVKKVVGNSSNIFQTPKSSVSSKVFQIN